MSDINMHFERVARGIALAFFTCVVLALASLIILPLIDAVKDHGSIVIVGSMAATVVLYGLGCIDEYFGWIDPEE